MLGRRLIAVIFPLLPWLAGTGVAAGVPEYGPESVVVVANRAMPESLEVAQIYMNMRDIPDNHLVLIDAPTTEHISRQAYLEKLHNPILTELVNRELVDAFEGPVDSLGRKTVSIFKKRIRYLVLCLGIPSKVTEATGELASDSDFLQTFFAVSDPAMIKTFSSGRLAKNEASVDGELSLLLERGAPLHGFIPNPLYGNRNRDVLTDILRVTRLDGPSVKAVTRMLDSSWKGELQGLHGRAYVDEDSRGGSFQVGNDWMAATADLFKNLGFDTSHNTARSTFSISDRFDAPVLYAGWYAANCNGPFTLPGFRFPEGAVAAHLHSFSATKIRSTSRGWVGPFVERGVACTIGNVAEPYLRLTHKVDAFFQALSQGWNFADAAYFALPGLSWQAVAVGDPLYRPFARTLDDQLEYAGDPLQILKDQYLYIRKANLLVSSGETEQALELLENQFMKVPGPALALARAQLYATTGQRESARSSLAFIRQLSPANSTSWGLLADIADELSQLGDHDSAADIYDNLIAQNMPEAILLAFIRRGIKVADKADNPELARRWRAQLNSAGALLESF